MAGVAAGWYQDPGGERQWRYWDGAQWTGHTAPWDAPAPSPSPAGAQPATGEPPVQAPAEPVSSTAPATGPRTELTPAAAGTYPVVTEDHHGGGLLSRFRKSDAEKAAEAEYEHLLQGMSAGTVELGGLGQRLRETTARAGMRERKASQMADRAFLAFTERLLDDDVLTETEEDELLAAGEAIGVGPDTFQTRFPDLTYRLVIAGANDGRLPTLHQPQLIPKRGEQVHLEFPAQLMKEVVHREFVGGSRGVSFRVAKGVRFHTGGFRGRSVVTGTSLEPADGGVLSVTSQRTVFQGSRKTQECRYDRLVGMEPYTDAIQLSVSNRQTPALYTVPNGLVIAAIINQAVQRTLE